MRAATPHGQDGFTMVEMLIALSIFSSRSWESSMIERADAQRDQHLHHREAVLAVGRGGAHQTAWPMMVVSPDARGQAGHRNRHLRSGAASGWWGLRTGA